MRKIQQILPTALGAAVLVNAAVATLRANLHAGIWFTYALGVILVLWGLLGKRLPRALHLLLTAGVTVAAACVLALYLYGSVDTATYTEEDVIVLGTGVRETELSASLQRRLDCAAAYHRQNPDAVIAVSGGQGPQEEIPEGEAMARYLLNQGVPREKLVWETASSSTAENFRFTKPLLDARFAADYRVAVITSDFHIFRAGRIAADSGYGNVTHAHAATPWYMILPNGLRECAAIVKYWLNL